jgi:hypothetical protein
MLSYLKDRKRVSGSPGKTLKTASICLQLEDIAG